LITFSLSKTFQIDTPILASVFCPNLRLYIADMSNLKLGSNANANIGVSVWNVLDKENVINNYYRISDETISETRQRSLGLTPNVVLRVFFN
jgi:hypothetical protein